MIVHLQITECLEYVQPGDCEDLIEQYRSISQMLVRLIEKWQ